MKTLLLCGALIAIAAPAAAKVGPSVEAPEVRRTTVSYADLDLKRAAGADVMIFRVRRAARSVCSNDGLGPAHSQTRRSRACVRQAMTGAFERLDAPLVTARFLKTAPQVELAATR